MALKPKQERMLEALILQCAFGSLGQAWGPTIGEINKFAIKWSKIGASQYQLQNIIDRFVSRGWLFANEEKIGTRKRRHYDISNYGMLALLAMTPHHNPSFAPLMANIGQDAIASVSQRVSEFLAMGGPNGVQK